MYVFRLFVLFCSLLNVTQFLQKHLSCKTNINSTIRSNPDKIDMDDFFKKRN